MKTFCNIINIFSVTFDQFNASLLKKSMNVFHSFKKKKKQLQKH